MKILTFIMLAIAPIAAQAEDKFKATNVYVSESKAWPIDQSTGYWMVEFHGVSQVSEGPIDTLAVECHGAGFWGAEGLDGNGICIHGEGDDTFMLRFDSKPDGNTWAILSGTGKYHSLTGSGTALTEALPGNRRISKLEGNVNLGN